MTVRKPIDAERVELCDRIKQLRAERKTYFDVEGDGVDTLLVAIQDHFDRCYAVRAADTEADEDAELVERFARAMFDEWPLHAVSPSIAEKSGQEIGSPLTYDKVLEMGGNHDGLIRLAAGAAKLHARLKPDTEAEGLRERLREAIDALEIALGPWQGAVKVNGEKFIQETRAALSPSDKRGPK